tara:strand:+ start:312 stop:413 length:102 start_codon:yes stop_codon:yes gene_type:complete
MVEGDIENDDWQRQPDVCAEENPYLGSKITLIG